MGFTIKTWELISIVLSALFAGMFHGAAEAVALSKPLKDTVELGRGAEPAS
jgi:hypothetical protein